MLVRLATLDDYPSVAGLNAEVQQLHAEALPRLFKPASAEEFTRAVFERMLVKALSSVYVAQADDDEVVGYLHLEILERPETWARYAQRTLYVHQLCVAQRHRQRGFGRRLLEHAAGVAIQQGITRLELDTWSFNATAHSLFSHSGFEEFNVRMARELS